MRNILVLFLLVGASVVGTGQPAPKKSADAKQVFTLEISAERDKSNPNAWDFQNPGGTVAKTDSMIAIGIRKTNTSQHAIDKISVEDGAGGYLYEVRDSAGNPVEPRKFTANGPIEPGDGRGFAIQGTSDMVLQPGESRITKASVGSWYDLSRPGTYTIQVSAHVSNDPSSGLVKSNLATVTVSQ